MEKKTATPIACCNLCGTVKVIHGVPEAVPPNAPFGSCTLVTKTNPLCGGSFVYLGTIETTIEYGKTAKRKK